MRANRYWYGPTGRISPEAPVPVVKVENNEERPGGAALKIVIKKTLKFSPNTLLMSSWPKINF